MIGLIGEPERKGRLSKTFGEALFECLLEVGDLMPLAWFALLCVAALSIIGAMVYQSILDPIPWKLHLDWTRSPLTPTSGSPDDLIDEPAA